MSTVADFIGVPTSGVVPLVVNFTDTSNFVATSWFWDFGDSHIDIVQNPSHQYDAPGTYTVTLTASNIVVGSKSVTKSNYITAVAPVPTASFMAAPIIGFEPLMVVFTNTSTGFPDSYLWDFGDSTTSIEQNPIHIYGIQGNYSVTLTAINTSGSNTSTPLTVQVLPVPDLVADFTNNNAIPGGGGLVVQFFDQSQQALVLSWDFGDPSSGVNNVSSNQNPLHTYSGPGVYLVTFTVFHGPFSDSICKSVLVTTDATRFMEIWGTAQFSDGTPVAPNRVVTVSRAVGATESQCNFSSTDTTHVYKTVDDAGVTRFLVRPRGNVLSIPDSGFQDNDLVYVYIGGRQATTQGNNIIPIFVPFYMTLPSNPMSNIEINVVFPVAFTTISPPPGIYDDVVNITLTSNVIPSIIYYTTDGSDPKVSPTRQLYVDPFMIEEGVTVIRYYTDDPLGSIEPTREAVYTILSPLVIPSPLPSDYSDNIFVTLQGNRSGDIYFRLNYVGGYDKYLSPIPIEAGPSGTRTTIIQAYLIDSHGEVGPIVEFQYKIDLINPVISVFTLSNSDLVTASAIITVQVVVASHTNSVTGLLLSTFSDFRDASVRLYQPEVTFLLPGPDGIKTVYVKVVDQLGHYSMGPGPNGTHTATIELNTEIPAFTVSLGPSEPIGESSFTFTGTKSANSGIFLIINDGPEMLVVPFSADTTWEYEVPLSPGISVLKFQAGTVVGNRSGIETRTIDDRPIPAGVTDATTITKPNGTWRIPFVFFNEMTGEEATKDIEPPKKQHENVKKRQHDFRIKVSANFGPDPIVTFPTEGMVLTEKVITVTGIAAPGSIITLHAERRGKVPA